MKEYHELLKEFRRLDSKAHALLRENEALKREVSELKYKLIQDTDAYESMLDDCEKENTELRYEIMRLKVKGVETGDGRETI